MGFGVKVACSSSREWRQEAADVVSHLDSFTSPSQSAGFPVTLSLSREPDSPHNFCLFRSFLFSMKGSIHTWIPEELAIVLSSLQLRGTSLDATEMMKRLQCEYFWRIVEQSHSTPHVRMNRRKLHVRTESPLRAITFPPQYRRASRLILLPHSLCLTRFTRINP